MCDGHCSSDMLGSRYQGVPEPVEVCCIEDRRRRQAQDVAGVERVGRDDLLVQQPDQELGRGVGRDEVDAEKQALTANLADQVRAVGGDGVDSHVADLRAKFACTLDQPFGPDGADGRGDRGGRERAARERRGMQQRVGVQRREQLFGCDDAPGWHHAAAEDLAREQHVGGDTSEVSAPPGAEPAHAGLDLIKDHHRTSVSARLPDLPQVAVGRQPDAPLGLDGLQQHHRLGRQSCPQRG